ncbi:ribonuclease H [uncultured Methanobrevibacter sp.]|uniref:ribonuclease H family protein n=1 Tax=uncultured Methanobrevibacter sp. TaxID=253161 RepID=UPI0026306102|nr:ribonuclease H [uncultured Methanobrevibacter sp.]
MTNYKYYTDGAATMIKENGQYLREAGGWAFITLKDNEIVSKQSGGCPLTTNNEMELYAIYASLRDFIDNSSSDDMIEICSDSGYCIDIFTKWAKNWKRRGWKKSDGKPIKNLEIIKATCDLIAQIGKENVTFTKVKGHSSNKLNREADQLAVSAKINAKKTQKTTGYNNKPDSLLGTKKEK